MFVTIGSGGGVRGHTGRSSWCWWPATKRRELKSCCCVPPMFVMFLGSFSPSSPLLLWWHKKVTKCKLWVISCISVGKMPAPDIVMWWSLMTTSWRPPTITVNHQLWTQNLTHIPKTIPGTTCLSTHLFWTGTDQCWNPCKRLLWSENVKLVGSTFPLT